MNEGERISLLHYIERVLEERRTTLDEQIARLGQAIEEADRRTQLALSESRRAVDKAEAAVETRLALLNEFRQQSADRDRDFVSKIAFDALKEVVDKQTGRNAGIAATAAVVIAVISIAITLLH